MAVAALLHAAIIIGDGLLASHAKTTTLWVEAAPIVSAKTKASAPALSSTQLIAGAASGGSASGSGAIEAEVANGPLRVEYPRLSREKGEEGTVEWEVEVKAIGTADSPRLLRSSGYSRLDEAARTAILASVFRPAMQGGKAVDSRKRIAFEFRLEN